jgi:hypothetical protein
MKKLIRFFVFAALVASFALPALAQTTPSTTTTPAATQDDTEAKTAAYKKFTDNVPTKQAPGNPTVAYEAGKEYLAKYEATDGPDDQYVKYIKRWVDSYEKIARRNQLLQNLKDKKYNEAFGLARQVLVDSPDDLPILFELSQGGLLAASGGNEANNADTINYAKKTIQLIQAGKTFQQGVAIPNKDVILGGLNYSLGFLLRNSPAESMPYFINAAQFEGPSKKDPQTYIFLADAYENTEYKNLATQFNNNCKTEDQAKTQACIDLKAKADGVLDHMIDALARAVAYSKTTANATQYDKARAAWLETLTNYYKYRNGSEAGLDTLIAGITSKPLPKPGEPIAPMTPAPSSSGTSSTTPSNMSTTTTTAKPGNTSTAPASPKTSTPSGKTTTTTASPTAGKTSSTKTTPKRAHTTRKQG